MMNTTKAKITKLINSDKKAPHLIETAPRFKVAWFQSPAGINGETKGIIILLTKDCTKEVLALPIMKASAKETILYSFKNSRNSSSNFILA